MLITILVSLWQKSSLKGELIILFCIMAETPPTHHYIKPCFTVLRIDFFHFNSSAGSFYKDEKVATTAEFEIVSSEIP